MVLSLLSALYFHQSTLLAWVAVAPLMLGIAMMYNVLLSFVSNAVSEEEQGDAMGSGTSLKALGWLSSGILVGGLYPHLINILVIMLVLVIIALLSTRWLKHQQAV
jgi:MFS family permease